MDDRLIQPMVPKSSRSAPHSGPSAAGIIVLLAALLALALLLPSVGRVGVDSRISRSARRLASVCRVAKMDATPMTGWHRAVAPVAASTGGDGRLGTGADRPAIPLSAPVRP